MTPMRSLMLCGAMLPALAHNYLTAPASFNGGGKGNRAVPCEPNKIATYAPVTVGPGTNVTLTWSTNHGGNHYYKMLPVADMDKLEDSTVGSRVTLPAGGTGTLTAPAAVGTYVVQYIWADYRNCFELVVGAAVEGETTPAPGQPDNSVDCPVYCSDFMSNCGESEWKFSSIEQCQAACSLFPTTGQPTDYTGNTLQCRWNHLHAEADLGLEHCGHASVQGGGKCTGGAFNHGISVVVGYDPAVMPSPESIKQAFEKTLTDMGYVGASVQMPVAEGVNQYNVIITFSEVAGHNLSPEKSVVALKGVDSTTLQTTVMAKQTGLTTVSVYSADSMVTSAAHTSSVLGVAMLSLAAAALL